jgi:hypothetical protein
MTIHPNTPPKLVKLLRKCGSFHKAAEEIEVNVYWIFQLVRHGIEPTDRTPKGRETRHRLGLHRYKPRGKPKPSQPRTEYLKWWFSLTKDSRHVIIERLHSYGKKKEQEP